MVFTASYMVQKYRWRIHSAKDTPHPSSTGPSSKTDSSAFTPARFAPVSRARITPSQLRFPMPKGIITRTPTCAFSSSGSGIR
ncbi:hypothetical protein DSECCO2_391710 [anaerobic digester metagenome]